jgi:AhpD family alkylhydroperoxidase
LEKFKRRSYHRLGELFSDLRAVLSERKNIGLLMRGELIAPAFRERLFLSVTTVNDCRYCSFVHSRQAFMEGISNEEIRALCDGVLDSCPSTETSALFYAQHWAEANATPNPEARERLVEVYGEQAARAIELALRIIRISNLLGNTLNYVLYRISFGRWEVNRPLRMGKPRPQSAVR